MEIPYKGRTTVKDKSDRHQLNTMKYLFVSIFSLIVLTSKAQNLKPTSLNDFVIECTKYNGEIPHKQKWPYGSLTTFGELLENK